MAIAPPFTFTTSGPRPSSRMDCSATTANASLISIRSRSGTDRPALARACLIALDGWECSELSGPATFPCAPISAMTFSPARSANSADVTTPVAGPSDSCEEVPAVIVASRAQAGALDLGPGELLSLAGYGDARDLGGEQAVLGRRGGALVGHGGELVLLLAGDAELAPAPLGGLGHGQVVKGGGQP